MLASIGVPEFPSLTWSAVDARDVERLRRVHLAGTLPPAARVPPGTLARAAGSRV